VFRQGGDGEACSKGFFSRKERKEASADKKNDRRDESRRCGGGEEKTMGSTQTRLAGERPYLETKEKKRECRQSRNADVLLASGRHPRLVDAAVERGGVPFREQLEKRGRRLGDSSCSFSEGKRHSSTTKGDQGLTATGGSRAAIATGRGEKNIFSAHGRRGKVHGLERCFISGGRDNDGGPK